MEIRVEKSMSERNKPRVVFIGFGWTGKRLIEKLREVDGFSAFLNLDTSSISSNHPISKYFTKLLIDSNDCYITVDLKAELSCADIAFVIDYYQDGSRNVRSAQVAALAHDCGAIPIKFHMYLTSFASSFQIKMIEEIRKRFAVADEALMRFARDTYAERGMLSSYEVSLTRQVDRLQQESKRGE